MVFFSHASSVLADRDADFHHVSNEKFCLPGKFDYDPELGTCSIMPDDNGMSAKTALFVIAFIVPAMLIFICYARIFWVVHR